jgi:hypothetical protein
MFSFAPLFLFCAAAAASDSAVFQERGNVFVAQKTIHVMLFMNVSTVLSTCETFHGQLAAVKDSFDGVFHREQYKSTVSLVNTSCSLHFLQSNVHTRPKRQALLAFGAGAVFGSIFGIYDFIQIQRLSTRIDELHHAEDRNLLVLRSHETRLHLIEQDMLLLNSSLTQVAYSVATLDTFVCRLAWLQDLRLQFDLLQEHIHALRAGWAALQHQLLPVEWIAERSLLDIMSALRQKARKWGGMVPFDHEMDIFQMPCSYLVVRDGVQVFLHVPIIREVMQLFELLPVPFLTGDQFMSVFPSKEFIMVAAGNRVHRELSSDELQAKCIQRGTYKICERLGFFHNRMETTCLGALMVNRVDKAKELCTIRKESRAWSVVQTEEDEFQVYTRDPLNLMTECLNGTRSNRRVQGVEKIQVVDQCRVHSDQFELIASSADDMRLTIVQELDWSVGIPWPAPSEAKPDLTGVRIGTEAVIADTPEWTAEHWTWSTMAISGILGLILVVILVCLGVRFFRRNAPPAMR